MENASKALLIAGAVLLVIAIIAIGMGIFGNARGVVNQAKGQIDNMTIQMHNKQFEPYDKEYLNSKELKELVSLVISNNKAATTNDLKIAMSYSDTFTIGSTVYILIYSTNNYQPFLTSINDMLKKLEGKSNIKVKFRYNNLGVIYEVLITGNI